MRNMDEQGPEEFYSEEFDLASIPEMRPEPCWNFDAEGGDCGECPNCNPQPWQADFPKTPCVVCGNTENSVEDCDKCVFPPPDTIDPVERLLSYFV